MLDKGIEQLAAEVLDRARELGVTMGSAESCTGGLVASALTEVAGSSDVFVGSVVSYWVDVKESVLGVEHQIIEDFGVVSEECAAAMACGARRVLGCDLAVSTTGIAGPTGAEPGKPVGTVCYGVAYKDSIWTKTICQGATRPEVRECAVRVALEFVKDVLSD